MLCPPPPNCLALSATHLSHVFPLLPLSLFFLPSACLVLSISPSHCVIHCLPAPYILYLNLIVLFILLSLPPLPCCLSQMLFNTPSTMECPRSSLTSNTVIICHNCCIPCCPLPPPNIACCHSHQMHLCHHRPLPFCLHLSPLPPSLSSIATIKHSLPYPSKVCKTPPPWGPNTRLIQLLLDNHQACHPPFQRRTWGLQRSACISSDHMRARGLAFGC
jgi:hypothetical protein